MTFRPELSEELLKNHKNPEDLMGEGGIYLAINNISKKRSDFATLARQCRSA